MYTEWEPIGEDVESELWDWAINAPFSPACQWDKLGQDKHGVEGISSEMG